MVRDLILDMKERDLLTEDKSNAAEPVFDSLWGNLFDEDEAIDVLICNIIIPEAYWGIVGYENGEMTCRFTSVYVPDTRHFRIRLVGLKNSQYGIFSNIRGEFGIPVNSYALSKNIAAPISACMLPYIDIDGEFVIKMVQNYKSEILDKAYIYSSKSTDISINYSDDQASQLLTLCAPGKSYRYPTTGVGITKYLNCIVSHSDLHKVLEAQFDADNKPIQDADFDNETCKLDVLFSPEKEVTESEVQNQEEDKATDQQETTQPQESDIDSEAKDAEKSSEEESANSEEENSMFQAEDISSVFGKETPRKDLSNSELFDENLRTTKYTVNKTFAPKPSKNVTEILDTINNSLENVQLFQNGLMTPEELTKMVRENKENCNIERHDEITML